MSAAPTAPASRQVIQVDGIDVLIEGPDASSEARDTLVMVHGWPDTRELWNGTVSALRGQYRCVRFTLPAFDARQPVADRGLDGIVAVIAQVVNAVSPGRPVTLVLHDWGCIFGYDYAAKHPDRVSRIVAVDIGDHTSKEFYNSLSPKAKRGVWWYQYWLAWAWRLGHISGALGNAMTRHMARWARCPAPPESLHWRMNYPYAMRWMGLHGGFPGLRPVKPHCPVLFLYGKKKPFMFHSPQWLERLNATPGSATQGFATGHWVMLGDEPGFLQAVTQWLGAVPPSAA